MRVLFDDRQKTIKEIALCFGGMAPTVVMATKTARELIGRSEWYDHYNIYGGPELYPNSIIISGISLAVSNFEAKSLTAVATVALILIHIGLLGTGL